LLTILEVQYYFGLFKQLLKKNKSENFAQTELLLKLSNLRQKALILLDNLLNWQKSQTGQLYFNPVSIKFKSIEQEIDDLFNSTAAVKNISLDYFYSEEIVICDKDMLLTICGT
jgi:hypothetical protein